LEAYLKDDQIAPVVFHKREKEVFQHAVIRGG